MLAGGEPGPRAHADPDQARPELAAHDRAPSEPRGPRLASPLITRRRLLDRLDGRRPLTVLRAPPGFGKTTLAAQWLRRRARPDEIVGWVRSPATADPAVFWSAVAEALWRAGLSAIDDTAGTDRARAQVRRALQRETAPVLVVIDDLDQVETRVVDDELLQLLRELPGLRLLIILGDGRRFPPGRVTDLDIATVRPSDLLFTERETRELAGALIGPRLLPITEAVHRECAGLPALTRAVLLEVADRPPPTSESQIVEVAAEIAGEMMRDALTQAPEVSGLLDFALLTSPAERLTGSLAETLTGQPGARSYLEGWLELGVLLVDRSGAEPEYYWPPAVRRRFTAELHRRYADRADDLHRRLAAAYRDDHPDWALEHALQARDWSSVISVIDRSWRSLLVQHRKQLYVAIAAAPVAAVRTSRRAMAMRDVMLQVSAEDMFSAAVLPEDEQALASLVRSERAPAELDVALAVLVAFRNCAPAEAARDMALRVLDFARATRSAHPDATESLFPGVLAQVAAALLAAGDRGPALELYHEAYRRAAEGSFDYLARDAASKLALIHALDGDLRRTTLWLRRYEQAPPTSSWLSVYFEPTVATAALLSALDRLAIEEAVELSDKAAPSLFPENFRGLYLYGRAMLALHDGRATDLLSELDEAGSGPAIAGGSPDAAALLAAATGDLLLALGRGNQARTVLFGQHRHHPALRVSRARFALLTGDAAGALRYAHDPQWERRAGVRSRHELTLIHAAALYRSGDRAGAGRALQRVVDAARTTGGLRPLVTVPRSWLRDMSAGLPAVEQLLDTPPVADQADLFPDSVPLVTLTQREALVLGRLAAGLSLQETADSLVVSYNTIRTQQASIYRKLGVSARADAIARARRWGLL